MGRDSKPAEAHRSESQTANCDLVDQKFAVGWDVMRCKPSAQALEAQRPACNQAMRRHPSVYVLHARNAAHSHISRHEQRRLHKICHI